MFLDNGIKSSPNPTYLHVLKFLSLLCGLNTNTNPSSSSLIILSINGLFCGCVSSMVRQQVIMCFNEYGHLRRDKLWDLKDFLRLEEIMSLFLQNFHVIMWSCMEDVVLYNVFRCLFPKKIICRLALVWAKSKCMYTNGFICKDVTPMLHTT